ncbi:MAG: hypothetical protein MUC36_03860 [Planctomycetes bacterium]|jgi:hypothetical protein|nr:hypothetical protein [Planctomycetota bacterium]
MTTRTFHRQDAPAGLDFSVLMPADWNDVPLPTDLIDLDDPKAFAPITILMAPYAAIVFAVTARPAFADGSVSQWLQYIADEHGQVIGAIERQALGDLAGVGCWTTVHGDGISMRNRIVFAEDGGRLLHISCMAPDALWHATADTFAQLLATFRLTAPRGSTAPLAPPTTALAACSMA